jgi:hypothetical protein
VMDAAELLGAIEHAVELLDHERPAVTLPDELAELPEIAVELPDLADFALTDLPGLDDAARERPRLDGLLTSEPGEKAGRRQNGDEVLPRQARTGAGPGAKPPIPRRGAAGAGRAPGGPGGNGICSVSLLVCGWGWRHSAPKRGPQGHGFEADAPQPGQDQLLSTSMIVRKFLCRFFSFSNNVLQEVG